MNDLRKIVVAKIEELGVKEASKFFGVATGTISNWHSGKTEPSLSAAQLVLHEKQVDAPQPIGYNYPIGEGVQLTEWEGRNLIILAPLYRAFSPDTHFSLYANYSKYGPEKIGAIFEKRTVIHESRNILVKKFLETTKAEYALFVDDDMVLPFGSNETLRIRYGAELPKHIGDQVAISRIMSHPKEVGIVGGTYYGRGVSGKPQCASGFTSEQDKKKFRAFQFKGLKQEEWVATGFMRIHRSVFEQMAKEIDAGRWPELKPNAGQGWYGFFTPLKVGVGEDVSFCRRAGEIGIKSYVDTELVCLHEGTCYYGPHNTKG